MVINNYIEQINLILGKKMDDSDTSFKLSMPDHKIKKYAPKINMALRQVHSNNSNKNVKMYHILLSLNQLFDMCWLVDNIIDDDIKQLITDEMKLDYSIKVN